MRSKKILILSKSRIGLLLDTIECILEGMKTPAYLVVEYFLSEVVPILSANGIADLLNASYMYLNSEEDPRPLPASKII